MEPSLAVAIGAVFAQVALVAVVFGRLLVLRWRAVKRRDVRLKEIALSNAAYDLPIQKVQNNLSNQFEQPVLFYVCVALAAATGSSSVMLAGCSVTFVALRWWHAAIHTGGNNVNWRFIVFSAASVALIGCWLALGVALLV